MYKIMWKSKITGYTGEGQPVFTNKEQVEKVVCLCNKEFPSLTHCWYYEGSPNILNEPS